jgi:drug/metabolite transporter (DMT)-like permease
MLLLMSHTVSAKDTARPESGAGTISPKMVPTAALAGAFVVLWSTGYPAARIALDHASPFTLLLLRFAGAGLIFALLAALGGASWPRGRAMVHSAAVGILTLGLQFSALYWAAAQGVNVGLIALVVGTMPIVTALLGLAFLAEKVRPLQWAGFAIGFGGVALVVGEGVGAGSGGAANGGAGLSAYLAVFVGLLAISLGTLYQKRHASNVDPRSGLAVQHLAAALPLLPFALHEGFRFDSSPAFFTSLAWVIGVNSLCAFALFFVLLRRGAVTQVATLFFLMPPATALIDYFVLGDSLTLSKLAGVIVAALGVFIATRAPAGTPRPAGTRTPQPTGRSVTAPCAAVRHSYQAPCR